VTAVGSSAQHTGRQWSKGKKRRAVQSTRQTEDCECSAGGPGRAMGDVSVGDGGHVPTCRRDDFIVVKISPSSLSFE
jgi:hypothetical protein